MHPKLRAPISHTPESKTRFTEYKSIHVFISKYRVCLACELANKRKYGDQKVVSYIIEHLNDHFSKTKSKLDTLVSALYLYPKIPLQFPKKWTMQNPSVSIDIEKLIPQDKRNCLDLVNHADGINKAYGSPKYLDERNRRQRSQTSDKQKWAESIK